MTKETNIKTITDFVKSIPGIKNKNGSILTPIIDNADTLTNFIAPVRMALAALTLANKLKFKSFLTQLARKIDEGVVTNTNIEKLENYLKKETNLEYIAEIIESSIQAKTAKCSAIMGYYAGIKLAKLREINYQDMVVLNALKIMTNNDLNYFCLLYKEFSKKSVTRFRVLDMPEDFGELGVPIFELENTIEKLKNIQVFGYDVGGIGGVGNAWGAFLFNENTHYLYGIIMGSAVMNNVDNYND